MGDSLRPRKPPAPLAEHARISPGYTLCVLCKRPVNRGTREARLPGSNDWAHLTCILERAA